MTGKRFRKIELFSLSLVLLALAFMQPNVVRADSGSPTTPLDLASQGWICLYIANPGFSYNYAFCMPPNYDGLGPAAITNKTFLVSDNTFANPVYLGTSIYIRSDHYAGQPCPTNSSPVYMEVLGGMYYNCRHFVQSYP